MLQTFDCPKCGAPVTYEPTGLPGQEARVRCQYCNSTLIVPDELRGQPARVVPLTIDLRSVTRQKGPWIWLLVAIPLVVGLFIVLAVLGALTPVFYSVNRTVKREANQAMTPRSLRPTEKPASDGFATVVMKFGTKGIGPGMFTDARSIAVDGAGHIYVGEYTGGRIQVFDPAGKFITQWSIGDRKTLLRGLAADRKGNVYVVHGGNIYRYEGATGNQLAKLQYEGDWGFDDIAAAADGSLLAAWYKNRDDIVRFNANGQAVKTIRAAISSASGDAELDTRVAIDGLGNIYALGTFNNGVFKFTSDGKFVNRFGGEGDKPGQIRAASAIAV
ncbi:MAG: hypothetical protein ABJB97_10575, partial [Acidobacteriota bacterium]